ncbi:MAG: Crp/Fnr family transcriptional regulator [Bacteroidota bacterium]
MIKTVAMTREKILNHKYRELLSECDLLNSLDKETSDAFLGLFKEEKWPKNTCILNLEKLSLKFHIVLSGRLKMYQVDPFSGKELTLFLLSKCDFFDIFCLLDSRTHTIYYECLDEVTVLSAPMKSLRNWLNKNPNEYKNFLPYAGKQLRLLENSLFEMTFNDIATRLLKLLIKNVNKNSRDLEFIHDLPDKEIAHLLGSTRAVVNRHLQRLKHNGSIKLSRNKMEVQDLGILMHMLNRQKMDSF